MNPTWNPTSAVLANATNEMADPSNVPQQLLRYNDVGDSAIT